MTRTRLYAGRFATGLAIAFLGLDAIAKVLELKPVIEGTVELGYPPTIVFGLGITLLASVIAYAVPRTTVLGAIVLTGYLGGAIATHVRVGNPLASHVLFPIYVATFVWGGLVLRDPRLAELLLASNREEVTS